MSGQGRAPSSLSAATEDRAAQGRAPSVVAVATGGEHQGHPPFRSRSIIDRTGLLDKFGQFRRAHAPPGLPSRAALPPPIDFSSPSPARKNFLWGKMVSVRLDPGVTRSLKTQTHDN